MHPSTQGILKERNISSPKEHFKKFAQTFFFQHHFTGFFQLSLCLFEILSRFNSNVVLHLPDHLIISYDLEHLQLNIVYQVSLLHPIVCVLARCICKQLIKSMGIYLFSCSHGGECIITHNIV
jgi:hypothetical protein